MKRTILLLFSLFFIGNIIKAQTPKLPAKKGTAYGETITTDGAISPDDITAVLQNKEFAVVKVKGKVVDVCHAKGCFLYLKTTTGKIYIKTKDDKFFVPIALEGKTVVVQGTASKDNDSKEVSIKATGILVI